MLYLLILMLKPGFLCVELGRLGIFRVVGDIRKLGVHILEFVIFVFLTQVTLFIDIVTSFISII